MRNNAQNIGSACKDYLSRPFVSTNSHSHWLGLKIELKDVIRLSKGSSKVREKGGMIGASTIEPLPKQLYNER